MKYAAVFAVLGVMLAAYAVGLGGWGLLLLWPAVSFLVVASAYAGAGPRLLGKRSDGRVAWWAVALHLPFFALTWGIWHVQRKADRRPAVQEVVPGLWIGRRLLASEVPAGVTVVVDLTAEFPEPAGVRAGRTYVCLPTLDAMVPEPAAFAAALKQAAAADGAVLVHCALGHGRTGLMAAAALVARRAAVDPKAALAALRELRPGIKLNAAQRRYLDEMTKQAGGHPPGA